MLYCIALIFVFNVYLFSIGFGACVSCAYVGSGECAGLRGRHLLSLLTTDRYVITSLSVCVHCVTLCVCAARLGISVGLGGIVTGLASTLAYMHPADLATYGQLMMLASGGGGVGYYLSTKIGKYIRTVSIALITFFLTLAAVLVYYQDQRSCLRPSPPSTLSWDLQRPPQPWATSWPMILRTPPVPSTASAPTWALGWAASLLQAAL